MAEHKHDFERDGLCIICDADFWQVAHEELARLRGALQAIVDERSDYLWVRVTRMEDIARQALSAPDRTVDGN